MKKNIYNWYLEYPEGLSTRVLSRMTKYFSDEKNINKGWRNPGFEPVLSRVSSKELLENFKNISGIGKKSMLELIEFVVFVSK